MVLQRDNGRGLGLAKHSGLSEHWRAYWPIKEFVDQKVSEGSKKTELARSIGTTDATMHIWVQKGFTPLTAFKAFMMLMTPERREKWENGLVVGHTRGVSHYRYECGRLAHHYDQQNAGRKFPMKGGGHFIIQVGEPPKPPTEELSDAVLEAEATVSAPVEVPEVVAAEPAAPLLADVTALDEEQEILVATALGDIRIRVPARPKNLERGTNELLIHLSQQLLAERDQLERQVVGLRSQLVTSESRRTEVEAENARLRDDVSVYEQLVSGAEATTKGKTLPSTVNGEIEEATRRVLHAAGATGLVHYLDTKLPKHQARS